MEDKLIKVLSSFGYPVIRQGSMTEDEAYPPTFFTIWNNQETEDKAYDNVTKAVLYNYDVNVYSSDPERAYELLREARKALHDNGFSTPDRGHDVMSDETTHIGRGMNVTIVVHE